MTGEEYNHINDMMQDLYSSGKLSEQDFDFICECIDKADRIDKYAWHDLRKNPEDLPETTRTVTIAYEVLEEKSGYKHYDVAFLGVGDLWYSAEVDNFEYHDEGFLVLAWQEIEPFESGV